MRNVPMASPDSIAAPFIEAPASITAAILLRESSCSEFASAATQTRAELPSSQSREVLGRRTLAKAALIVAIILASFIRDIRDKHRERARLPIADGECPPQQLHRPAHGSGHDNNTTNSH
eukprot:scaffold1255_cov247-Prasinococcus_capsulatus_cf.AAC.1